MDAQDKPIARKRMKATRTTKLKIGNSYSQSSGMVRHCLKSIGRASRRRRIKYVGKNHTTTTSTAWAQSTACWGRSQSGTIKIRRCSCYILTSIYINLPAWEPLDACEKHQRAPNLRKEQIITNLMKFFTRQAASSRFNVPEPACFEDNRSSMALAVTGPMATPTQAETTLKPTAWRGMTVMWISVIFSDQICITKHRLLDHVGL